MADTTNRLAGTAYVTVDGVAVALVGELSYKVSTVSRETLTGMDAVHGYSEKPNAGSISGTFRDSAGLSVAGINAMTNSTVTLELANGKTIIGRNMWTVETQEVKTGEATLEVKWEGPDVSES